MGSGQSSVKGIKIEQSDNAIDKRKKKSENVSVDPETKITSHKNEASSKPSSSSEDFSGKDAEIASLTKQLCDSESQRLDLEDRVQALEERIEELNNQTLMTETKPCDETLHVKDQYISKLEKEIKDLETESNKMKQKHRRKIKQLNSQMAEFKQETHFEMMELKDEIQKLTEENKKLKGSAKVNEFSQSNPIENTPKLPGGEKMKLILELSEQVTEQGDKISKLERKVIDRDHTIEELRVRLKNNCEYLKASDQAGLSARGERNHTSSRGDKFQTASKQYWGSSSPNVSSYKLANTINVTNIHDDTDETVLRSSALMNISAEKSSSKLNARQKENDVDDLFAIQGDVKDDDDDLDNSASMKKLSDLLLGTKADDKKARESFEALNSDRQESENQLYQIDEENLESGNGRDSGLGSAGKRANENNASDTVLNSHKNWRESSALSFESEISDSDSVSNLRLQNKVSSAPPKLQNQGRSKLKKKTRSLRKHITDKTDRPPRPGLAFVNSSENGAFLSDSNITSLNKLPAVLSPVNVS